MADDRLLLPHMACDLPSPPPSRAPKANLRSRTAATRDASFEDVSSTNPSLRLNILMQDNDDRGYTVGMNPEETPKWRPYESFQKPTPRHSMVKSLWSRPRRVYSNLRQRVCRRSSQPPSDAAFFANDSTKWRLLDRKAPFHQSRGVWNIRRSNKVAELYFADVFHTIIDLPTYKSILIFFALYIFWIFVFAWLYYAVSDPCELDIVTFRSAWYFSVETIMTIGYGTYRPEGCAFL